MRFREVLRIGYINYKFCWKPAETLESYYKRFDILIINDGSLQLPEMILEYVVGQRPEEDLFAFLEEHQCSFDEASKEIIEIREKLNL